MMCETMVAKIFRKYLDMQGYTFSDDDLCELVDVYLDCQEWDDDKPVTGTTEVEMIDWIKHTREVVRLASEKEREMGIKRMLVSYIEISRTIREKSKKRIFEIDIAS